MSRLPRTGLTVGHQEARKATDAERAVMQQSAFEVEASTNAAAIAEADAKAAADQAALDAKRAERDAKQAHDAKRAERQEEIAESAAGAY